MADYGFLGSVSEFIELCDSNRIAETIRDSISQNMLTTNNEFRSWRDGLQKLSNYLRILGSSNETIMQLGIICELCFARGRADVVLTGCHEGANVAVIIEIKQWSIDGIDSGPSPSIILAHVGNEARVNTTHPLLQSESYAHSMGNQFDDSELTLIPIAMLPNMEPNSIISSLKSARRGENLFLKRNIREMGTFLGSVFSAPDHELNICRMITSPQYPAPEIITEVAENEVDEQWSTEHELLVDETPEDHLCGFIGGASEFIELCDNNTIADEIRSNLGVNYEETHSEYRSWREGLYRVSVILREVGIPLGVACEVKSQAGCIDVVLSGRSDDGRPVLFVIELKQWSLDGVGEAFDSEKIHALVGAGGLRPTRHPLLQCRSYRSGLQNYKMYFEDSGATVLSIAFLPNFSDPEGISGISDERYDYLSDDDSFLFALEEHSTFTNLILDRFSHGDENAEIIREVINSPRGITTHMMSNIRNFLEEPGSLTPNPAQRRAMDEISRIANEGTSERSVIVVRGGPGTGKTVVGFLSMLRLASTGMNLRFVACNNPVTRVLRGRVRRAGGGTDYDPLIRTPGELRNEFKGGIELDLLIADEAQSITPRTGMAANASIDEMIGHSRLSVFFIDERQMTNINSYGTLQNISESAQNYGVSPIILNLMKQERCGSSSHLLPLVGATLGYGDPMPEIIDFPFEVFESAEELRREILSRNSQEGVEAALIASYCWVFLSKNDPEAMDIVLDDGSFQSQWNQPGGGPGDIQFMTDPTRDDRVGYPPEVQGQELDYAGLIMGPDLFVNEEGELAINPLRHAFDSPCVPGRSQSGLEKSVRSRGDEIVSKIRNQYWVLMTRASRGLFLYSEDEEVREYFREITSRIGN